MTISPTLLVLIPSITLLACLLFPKNWERSIANTALGGILLTFLLFLGLVYVWVKGGFADLSFTGLEIYESLHYHFFVDFFLDTTSVVFFAMTCLTTMLIFLFSKYYMHRDPGFKRFYNTILVFFAGLTFVIFAGNFETLFLGWEFIGISSFLLIAFYRDRFLPAKNSLKVFSLYRIADAFFLIALWYAHHLFGGSIHFSEFSALIAEYGNELTLLGVFFLIVALIKSAQYPFSYWLPRAMEGPTTSSAIFYGALSIHMGLFVLIRTYPLWEGSLELKIATVCFGLVTALVATTITRVQSSIKSQIAYASITQIGIMFVEVALGLHFLALFHFVSNALLRSYQLLISPSIVGYLIHEQLFHFVPPAQKIQDGFFGKIRATFYILAIREWNMDSSTTHYFWKPVKQIGRGLKFLDTVLGQVLGVILLIAGALGSMKLTASDTGLQVISTVAAVLGLVYYFRAFEIKKNPKTSWNLTFIGHLFVLLFLAITAGWNWAFIFMYAGGVIVAYILGLMCLAYLEKRETITLEDFQGHVYEYPRLANLFFLVCLAFMAFPVTPSFLGQEILLSSLSPENTFQIVLFGLAYFFSGITIFRIFGKIFFGPHQKSYHEIAYKSS